MLPIVLHPHPALRFKARPVTRVTDTLRQQAMQMFESMYEANGVGLAAPQVALPYQMFILNTSGDPEQKDLEKVVLNPEILEKTGTAEGTEGCLSFPELFQKVRRAKIVRVKYQTLDGTEVEETLSGLPGKAFQHEYDHLHGVLFIDKLGPIGKIAARGAIAAFERMHLQAQKKGEIPSDAELLARLEELAKLA
jgi:peptide deformylase